MTKKTYIESVHDYYVEIYAEAVKTGYVGTDVPYVKLKDFIKLNQKWDKAYHKLKVDKK